ncbi:MULTISPECIES: hypothetical protein [Embleya]|uniref:Uncharacterized protein n=2 Tax=Embleya TaxID=2699295 RepID=A0A1T3NVF4_9ACTN|nr:MULTISPECIES: hypothetical protein [Embleya]OPC80778.1 hypothetical protein B4N89_07255 [Embleya scabrispora]GCD99914.1 hypothetical protein EHYA_07638 [Embleya hyalina]
MPRIVVLAVIVCVLALAAAVVAFVNGSWLGLPFVLLAALDGNIAFYYLRRQRVRRARDLAARA